MTLTTEENGDITNVTAAEIERTLMEDVFGKFAILSSSDFDFIQCGNDWQPGAACEQFLQQYDSDPWVLEYRDGASSQQFRAGGWVSLDQALRAFLAYLAGTDEWRTSFEWSEMHL